MSCLNYIILPLFQDRPRFGQYFFQDPATYSSEVMVNFHHEIMVYMLLLFILILWFLIRINYKFYENSNALTTQINSHLIGPKDQNLNLMTQSVFFPLYKRKYVYKEHNTILEILWTILPTLLLFSILIPSLNLLYLLETPKIPTHNIKVIGSQWYWTYEYNNFKTKKLENIKIPELGWANHKTVVQGEKVHVTTTDFEGVLMKKAKSFSPSNGNPYVNFSEDNTDKFTLSKTSHRYFTEEQKAEKEKRRLLYQKYFEHPDAAVRSKNLMKWFEGAILKKSKGRVLNPEEFKAMMADYQANLPKEITRFQNLSLQSNLIPTDDLSLGDFRLLTVTENLILPRGATIRFLVSSTDVLHSWCVPSLGIKIDACPGRLNEFTMMIYRSSVFYGQCSEICGVLHGFMPIVLYVTDASTYYSTIFKTKWNF